MFAVSSLESNGDETTIWSKEKGRSRNNKKIVLGTLLSQHNIGKNLVGTLLSIGGFEVVDMGEKNAPWDFYEAAEQAGADVRFDAV
jgi:methanogenic corrinoid protein MtbC1